MRKIIFLVALTFAYSCESQTKFNDLYADSLQLPQQKVDLPLPIATTDTIFKIDDLRNASLQTILEKEINKNKVWKNLVSKKLMAIGIVDLADMKNIKFAGINDNNMMYAASLPKIAVLLAAMDAIEKGELKDSKEIQKDMKLMISKSNNAATTRMIDRVGYEKIEEVMKIS